MRLSRSTRKGIGFAVAALSVAILIGLVFLPKASVIKSDIRAEIKALPIASHLFGHASATGRG